MRGRVNCYEATHIWYQDDIHTTHKEIERQRERKRDLVISVGLMFCQHTFSSCVRESLEGRREGETEAKRGCSSVSKKTTHTQTDRQTEREREREKRMSKKQDKEEELIHTSL